MRNDSILRRLAAGALALALLTGCAGDRGESPSGPSAGVPEGAVGTYTAALDAVPAAAPEALPELFTEGERCGFLAPDGSVLVPAEYEMAYPFSDRSLGKVRGRDGAGEIIWYTVGIDGRLLPLYNHTIRELPGYGTVVQAAAADGDMLYDLTLSPLLDAPVPVLAVQQDGEELTVLLRDGTGAAELLPEEGALLYAEPAAEGKDYRALYAPEDCAFLLVNGEPVSLSGGAVTRDGEPVPAPVVEALSYTLLPGGGEGARTAVTMQAGPIYENTVVFVPEGLSAENCWPGTDLPWIAVPGASAAGWTVVTPGERDLTAYRPYLDGYLAEKAADPEEVSVTGALEADGGLLLTLGTGAPATPTEEDRALSAVLFFPDAADPSAWRVLEENDCTGSRALMARTTYKPIAVGELGGTPAAVVLSGGYELSAALVLPLG